MLLLLHARLLFVILYTKKISYNIVVEGSPTANSSFARSLSRSISLFAFVLSLVLNLTGSKNPKMPIFQAAASAQSAWTAIHICYCHSFQPIFRGLFAFVSKKETKLLAFVGDSLVSKTSTHSMFDRRTIQSNKFHQHRWHRLLQTQGDIFCLNWTLTSSV